MQSGFIPSCDNAKRLDSQRGYVTRRLALRPRWLDSRLPPPPPQHRHRHQHRHQHQHQHQHQQRLDCGTIQPRSAHAGAILPASPPPTQLQTMRSTHAGAILLTRPPTQWYPLSGIPRVWQRGCQENCDRSIMSSVGWGCQENCNRSIMSSVIWGLDGPRPTAGDPALAFAVNAGAAVACAHTRRARLTLGETRTSVPAPC